MAITASTPDAFLDAEPWVFTLSLRQPDSSSPLDLTGSRLFVNFCPDNGTTPIGKCDSAAGDGSLSIAAGSGGGASFLVTNVGRTWTAPRSNSFGLTQPTIVTGDLYRLPPGQSATWEAACRITFPVLPSTGLPAS